MIQNNKMMNKIIMKKLKIQIFKNSMEISYLKKVLKKNKLRLIT